ncbi:uncharacterized protein LOC117301284 isoform X2 [Asterias rubens]|uniref:uncharacterized protein LOC117301284 isoform X2 n=1 Tax=Asterias rubens TaxID=7604 RepID=UPI0014559D74|nr:uncharacterized protein LOC117301284 isoform X2 [Asterias rubens]XP_033641061.1 uncharacterized protein LOC117301284 isoform X2 [Asterias rubens]
MAHPIRLLRALVAGGVFVLIIFIAKTTYDSQTDVNHVQVVSKSEERIIGHARTTQTTASPNVSTNLSRTASIVKNAHPKKSPDQTSFGFIDTERGMMDLDALFRRLVIVTAVSDNHVGEVMGMIASAQKHMPDTPIYVYNLGLNAKNLKKLSAMCNVHMRRLVFRDYPAHVRDLHMYAWKVVIMRETLTEFGAIFYGDASVRFTGSLRTLFPYLHLHHGYMCHIHGFDPKIKQKTTHQYFKTHMDMYAELGVDREKYFKSVKEAPHISAGRILMVNNSIIRERLLIPLYECAMRKQCIKPKGAKTGGHRYDASALAIIVYKNLRNEWTEENNNVKEFDEIVDIKRTIKDKDGVKYCGELPI